jgi:hypothetical protein
MLESNYTWGLSLIAVTMAVHAMGITVMGLGTMRIRHRLEQRCIRLHRLLAVVACVIGAVGLLLAVLHGLEATLWALAYLWLGALNLPADAILYSVDSITTRGASGLRIEPHWQMMGALEAADGMLLFGISTAFVFTAMNAYWPMLTRHLQH